MRYFGSSYAKAIIGLFPELKLNIQHLSKGIKSARNKESFKAEERYLQQTVQKIFPYQGVFMCLLLCFSVC